MSVLYQSMYIFKTGLSDGWENIKKKYLMCQIPIKTLKGHGIPNSGSENFKTDSQKGSERLVKDELCMNLTAVLKS